MEKETNIPDSGDVSKNYDLNSQAVEDLASDTAPEYSEEELKRYRSKGGFRIPELIKILFLKFWFYGAVCYFIVWGLGYYLSVPDQVLVMAIALGMVTDLLLNNVIRFIEKLPGGNDKWLAVTHRKMIGFGLNLLYGGLMAYCVYQVYVGINTAVAILSGASEEVALPIEPLLFGLLCMAFDMLFIGIKRLFGKIIRDAKDAAASH